MHWINAKELIKSSILTLNTLTIYTLYFTTYLILTFIEPLLFRPNRISKVTTIGTN